MANCQHCEKPNPEGMFNCPSCGKRAAPNKWNTNFVIRENNSMARAIRTDQIDFNTLSMEESMKKIKESNSKAKPAPSGKGIRVM
tara:strand:+ start:1068 stop:1322 length:255 start_codon:yes stop_codon:yes gene_type:complete